MEPTDEMTAPSAPKSFHDWIQVVNTNMAAEWQAFHERQAENSMRRAEKAWLQYEDESIERMARMGKPAKENAKA